MARPDRRGSARGIRPRVSSRDARLAYLLLSPAVLLLALVLGYPLVWEVWISLTDFRKSQK